MRILTRRFLASYLVALAACVGACVLALAIVDMLVDFDAVVEGGAAALARVLAHAPGRWLREALPLASFAAAFLCVALPGRRGEILALCAAGIHPARVALPILGAALGVGAASGALPGPDATREPPRLAALGAGGGAPIWLAGADRLVRVADREPGSGELRDVRIFETDPRFRLRRSLRAARARVAGDRWELHEPRALRLDPNLPAAPPRSAPAPAWLPAPAADDVRTRAGSAAAPPSEAAAPRAAAVGVLALLAIPLGLGVRASGPLASRALAGLGLAALFRGAWQAAAFAGERVPVWDALAPWLVLCAFAAAAAALWARALRAS